MAGENYRPVRLIGPYTEGEIPDPLLLKFYEEDKDLSGWSIAVTMTRDGVELNPGGTALWEDDTLGIGRYEFADGDIDVTDGEEKSSYRMEFWAGNGTLRLASLLVLFDVNKAVGTVPAI